MPDQISEETKKIIAWRLSLTEEERQKFIAENWHIIEELRSLPGEPPTDEEWEEISREARAKLKRVSAPRR
jgi:hypothetical protein